jgi:hypothetical protein
MLQLIPRNQVGKLDAAVLSRKLPAQWEEEVPNDS